MKTFDLGFGQIIQLEPNLAEVIINEGVEMDMNILGQYHEWIIDNLSAPSFLLVNKVHPYTYTFEAQQHLADLEKVKAIAMVCYSTMTDKATRFVAKIPKKHPWQYRTFDNRKSALQWLTLCNDELCVDNH
jgi:hypothetical protein